MLNKCFFNFLGSPAFSPRSFPPSPQRTPSRKQSLVCVNPFALCPTALDEIQKNPQEACETVSRLLDQVYTRWKDFVYFDRKN